jgi:LCP family protein required for cell wall assembly
VDMSGPKPTADQPSRAKRLGSWWEGWPRLIVLGAAGLGALVVVVYALQGIRLVLTVEPAEDERVAEELDRQPEGYFVNHPRNVLLLGSDSRAHLSAEEQVRFGSEETVEGERSDTMILLHIDPRREKAVAIHFPRDLRVEIPGHGTDKINAAYELGGSRLAVRTVRRFTGLPIHTYVEVDLAGFQSLIDTLGGVRICVDRPMFDELAGLSIPTAGCHTLNGDEALAFARARHVEGDRIPDFSRITRQQQLMRSILNRVLSAPSLLDAGLITEAASNVTTDPFVTTTDFLYLGSRLQELAQEDGTGVARFDFRVVPGTPELIDGVSYVIAQQPEADELFRRLREGEPLGDIGRQLALTQLSPAQVVVQARDAGNLEETSQTTAYLRRAGFQVEDPAAAPSGYTESVILYRPGSAPNAQVVKGYFPDPAIPVEEAPPELFGGKTQVLVIVGPDFAPATGP